MSSSDLSSLTRAAASTGARGSSAFVRARPGSRWKLAWMGFGVWRGLVALSLAPAAVGLAQRGLPIQWTSLVAGRSIDWYTCALFTPVFFWLVRRYPLDTTRRRTAVPLYVAVTSACVVTKSPIMLLVVRRVGVWGGGPGRMPLAPLLGKNFLLGFLFFRG